MATSGFEFKEFAELAKGVQELEKQHQQFVEDFLLEMALCALWKVKKRTPVDTGDLRDKWYLSSVVRRGNDIMIHIINPDLYASCVEYGYWQEVALPTTKEKMWVDGWFMLTITMQEMEQEIPIHFKQTWKKFASNLLKGD